MASPKRFLRLLASILCSLCAIGWADGDIKPQIDKLAQPLIGKRTIGMAVGILQGDKARVFGYGSVVKGIDRPPDGDTVFEIGSVSKVFTAIALADMAREGLVRLDDPVRLYLPSDVTVPSTGSREITLLDLVTHRSGLPRMPSNFHLAEVKSLHNPYKHYSTQHLYSFLANHRLRRKPGDRYEYSNLGFALLGQAMERKTGRPYEEIILERVCRPLGLHDTRQTLSPDMTARLARGYRHENGKNGLEPTLNWDLEAFAAAGGLRSTANDMLRFISANLGRIETDLRPIFNETHEPRARTDSPFSRVGLAWHIENRPFRRRQVIMHNGGTGGYHSYLAFVKETQTGVVVLSNSDHFTDWIGARILNLLESDPRQ